MFGSVKKRVDEAVSTNDIETVIGKNTHIKGDIEGSSNVRIDGTVDGAVSTSGNVVIGAAGNVTGDIKAANLIVSGVVTGNAAVAENLCIYATGKLIGDVTVKTFNLDEGGVFKGHCEMSAKAASTEPLAKTAALKTQK